MTTWQSVCVFQPKGGSLRCSPSMWGEPKKIRYLSQYLSIALSSFLFHHSAHHHRHKVSRLPVNDTSCVATRNAIHISEFESNQLLLHTIQSSLNCTFLTATCSTKMESASASSVVDTPTVLMPAMTQTTTTTADEAKPAVAAPAVKKRKSVASMCIWYWCVSRDSLSRTFYTPALCSAMFRVPSSI
jgi:hypothetical protein